MAHAYTPGLKVASHTKHRVRRVLPIQGDVLVKVGDRVASRDVVAESFMPGDVMPMNLANALSMPPADVAECVLKKEGDRIEVGEILARTKGIFGFLKSEYKSRFAGTIESISHVTGQVIVRGSPQAVRVLAYLSGQVVEVFPREGVLIENDVTFIQGIFGVGGETYGEIALAGSDHSQALTPDLLKPEMKDNIVVSGARVTTSALAKGVEIGVAAIITGGIDDQDLKEFLGHDLGVAITGSEQVGLTLIITEGFGDIAMAERTWQLLASRAGKQAAVNGATQIRAGVMRPEIVIPLDGQIDPDQPSRHPRSSGYLSEDTPVRIIRDPYFGMIGKVASLPSSPQVLASGSKARVLRVELPTGEQVTVPRANVELIEE